MRPSVARCVAPARFTLTGCSRSCSSSAPLLPPLPLAAAALPAWQAAAQRALPSLRVSVLARPPTGEAGGAAAAVAVVFGARHDCASAPAEVAAGIGALRPQYVCVELCQRRFRRLLPLGISGFEALPPENRKALRAALRCGGEQLEAALAAGRCGAEVVLGDRDVRATEARFLASLPGHVLYAGSRAALCLPDLRVTLAWVALGWRLRRFVLRGSVQWSTRAGASLSSFDVLALPAWVATVLPEAVVDALLSKAQSLVEDKVLAPSERWRRMSGCIEVAAEGATASMAQGANEVEALLGEAVKRIVIDERDEILCRRLWELPGPLVVAVVGVAHVEGMSQRWATLCEQRHHQQKGEESPAEAAAGALLATPRLELWRRVFGWPLLWRLRGSL